MRLYGIVMVISFLSRQFWIPNPFECFGEKSFVINLLAEPFLHFLTYMLVGLVYRKGECPAYGSFLYIVFYAGIVFALQILSVFSFVWWWILIVVSIIIAFARMACR